MKCFALVKNNQLDELKAEFLKDPQILKLKRNGGSLCHIAAFYGALDVLKWLKKQGLDVFEKSDDKNGKTPLHMAAGGGQVHVLRYFSSDDARGDCFNETDVYKRTALMWAVIEGKFQTLQFLLEFEAVKSMLNHQCKAGRTALMYAARMGHQQMVDYLIRVEGANPTLKDIQNRTPLVCAAVDSRIVCVQYLLKCTHASQRKSELVAAFKACVGTLPFVKKEIPEEEISSGHEDETPKPALSLQQENMIKFLYYDMKRQGMSKKTLGFYLTIETMETLDEEREEQLQLYSEQFKQLNMHLEVTGLSNLIGEYIDDVYFNDEEKQRLASFLGIAQELRGLDQKILIDIPGFSKALIGEDLKHIPTELDLLKIQNVLLSAQKKLLVEESKALIVENAHLKSIHVTDLEKTYPILSFMVLDKFPEMNCNKISYYQHELTAINKLLQKGYCIRMPANTSVVEKSQAPSDFDLIQIKNIKLKAQKMYLKAEINALTYENVRLKYQTEVREGLQNESSLRSTICKQ